MSRTSEAPDTFPAVKPDTGPGLQDPRTIHPSPEDLLPTPGEPQQDIHPPESEPPEFPDDSSSDDPARGIVDPRNESVGPDI
jgi:hypothetical protein